MKKFIIAIVFIIPLINACRKDDEVPEYMLSGEVKDFLFYKPNSQWIYINDTTAAKDTVTIVESAISMAAHESDMKIDYKDEQGYINYYSTAIGLMTGNYSYNDRFYARHGRDERVARNGEWDKIVGEFLIWKPVPGEDPYILNFHTSSELIATLTVPEGTYTNVTKFRTENNKPVSDPGYLAADFYYVKHVGIIKKVFYQDNTSISWSLVKKSVLQ